MPPYQNVDADTELDMAEKSPFTAHDLALRRGRHHPRLWAKVKGSPFEREYRRKFGQVEAEDPKQVFRDSTKHSFVILYPAKSGNRYLKQSRFHHRIEHDWEVDWEADPEPAYSWVTDIDRATKFSKQGAELYWKKTFPPEVDRKHLARISRISDVNALPHDPDEEW